MASHKLRSTRQWALISECFFRLDGGHIRPNNRVSRVSSQKILLCCIIRFFLNFSFVPYQRLIIFFWVHEIFDRTFGNNSIFPWNQRLSFQSCASFQRRYFFSAPICSWSSRRHCCRKPTNIFREWVWLELKQPALMRTEPFETNNMLQGIIACSGSLDFCVLMVGAIDEYCFIFVDECQWIMWTKFWLNELFWRRGATSPHFPSDVDVLRIAVPPISPFRSREVGSPDWGIYQWMTRGHEHEVGDSLVSQMRIEVSHQWG